MAPMSALVIALAVLVAATSSGVALAAGASPRCGDGKPSGVPVNTAAPVLQRTVRNGKRYSAGQGNDTFSIVHVYGSSYDMGFAHGQLMAAEIAQLQGLWMGYIEHELKEKLHKSNLPQWILDLLAEFGVTFLLDLTYEWTSPFTPQKYIDEMHGVADGAGVTFDFVKQINMFPELVKAACTVVGATGASNPWNTIQHLRGLDFGPTAPIVNCPQVTVYHGDGTPGVPKVANFGWCTMIGSLTGISDTEIGIGEKVWDGHPKGINGVHGQPWMFILRDTLMAPNLNAALATLKNANRTCAIHVGVGDSTTNQFRGVQMAEKAFEVFNDTSIEYPQHPIIPGVFYWDKHVQPTGSYCLSDLLLHYYGNITAEVLATKISSWGRTGDMHSVAFDYGTLTTFFANARKTWSNVGPLPGYDRQYTKLDVKKLFAEKKAH